MAKSALVIGIGSSGYHMILRALQFHYEFTKNKRPDHCAFMFLDTASQDHEFIRENIISYTKLESDNITAKLNSWKKSTKDNFDMSWVPEESDMKNLHDGADGKPAFGRFCLWAKEQNVRQEINRLYNDLNGDGDTNIYIVGSLVGGTGSGIFLDVAGLVRKETRCRNVYGMFTLPGRQDVGINGKEVGFENAYLSLKTLDYYSKSNKTDAGEEKWYECVMPEGSPISLKEAPFRSVQFFTRDFNSAAASLPDVVSLTESAGFSLALRIMDVTNERAPFQELINERVGDYTGSKNQGIFSTMGMLAIQYPEGLLEEYLATTFIKEKFLEAWSDANYCRMPDGKSRDIKSLTGSIDNKTKKALESAIDIAIQRSRSLLKSDNVDDPIAQEVGNIIEKKYKNDGYESAEDYVFSLFATNNSANLYGSIRSHELTLRDSIVDSLTEYIYAQSLAYPNINVVSNILDFVSKSIQKLIKRWKAKYQIDGTTERWDDIADDIIGSRIGAGRFLYNITTCKYQHLYEAIDGVVQLSYFNNLIPILESIADSLESKDGVAPLRSENHTLPTKNAASMLLQKIEFLLDARKDNSVMKRHGELENRLNGSANPQFIFLYKGESFESDIKTAIGTYSQKKYELKLTDLTSNISLWEFLEKNKEGDLKEKIIDKMTLHVHEKKLFEGNNVVDLMKEKEGSIQKISRILNKGEEEIRALLPAMTQLDVNYNFESHIALKLIVVSDKDSNNPKGIVKNMKSLDPNEINSTYVKLPSLINTVVLYQEYRDLGGEHVFNPLLHLDYQNQVKSDFLKVSAEEHRKNLKFAYLDYNVIANDNNIKIK